MAVLTREQVLARKLGRETVDLGDGDQVVVRGLSRDEAHNVQQLEDVRERDLYMIATGVVEPDLTEADVAEWFAGDAAGALNRVAAVITRLSGMGDGQGKDATKSVPRGRGRGRS